MALSDQELEIERAKIEIEKKRLEVTEEVQKRELSLKEQQHKERSVSAAQATIAGAAIALLSGVIGASISSSSGEKISETNAANALIIERTKVQGSLDLEESKQTAAENLARLEFESSLILKAIETDDRDEAIRNLRFFVSAGFISDEGERISQLRDEELPSQVSLSSNEDFLTRMWKQDTIAVCWENADAKDQRLLSLVENTVAETWQQHSRLQFVGWTACPAEFDGVRVRIDDVPPHSKALGRNLAGLKDGVVLNFAFEDFSPVCAQKLDFCIKGYSVHEFGHVLGFTHEQNRSDRSGDCAIPRQGQDDDFFLTITPYDPNSVMNFCNSTFANGGELSELDKQKLRFVYGDSPLPYCAITKSC